MGNYSQWRTSQDKGEVRRVIYLCGSEHLLKQEVVAVTLNKIAPGPLDYVAISAREVHTNDIVAAAMQYPLDPGAPRLVYVRDAEKLRYWGWLGGWFDNARRMAGTHLLFHSNEADPPSTKDGLAEHIELIRSRRHGQVVRCGPLNPTDAIAWVRRRGKLDAELAIRLLTRVGFDLNAAADACDKLTFLPGPHAWATIAALSANEDDFIDALLGEDKPTAARAVHDCTAATITQLINRVDLLADLWKAVRSGAVSARDIKGHPPQLVARYLHLAAKYHPDRCTHARQVLAVTEDAYRRGARDGVFEALVALW
jgi:hypothetical protein